MMNRLVQQITFVSIVTFLTVFCVAAEPMQLVVNGRTRTLLIERPAAQGPRPTIIMLHEAGGTAGGIAQQSGLARLAPQQGFAAVFPQGLAGSRWNIYPSGKESAVFVQLSQQSGGIPEDTAFIKMLVADLVRRGISDPKRIYLAGYSNGGFMTLRMICVDAGLFAAIGLLMSGMPEPTASECSPATPIPVLVIKGTADQTVPYGGGIVRSSLAVWSTARLIGFFRQLDRCAEPAQHSVLPSQHPQRIEIEESTKCSGGPVVLYRIVGGGHELPPTLNAGQLLLDFFRERAFAAEWLCAEERGAKSVASNASTAIIFNNKTTAPIKTFWIDLQGERKFYRELAAGANYRQQTYVNHLWVVTSAQDRCLGFYRAEAAAREVTIDP